MGDVSQGRSGEKEKVMQTIPDKYYVVIWEKTIGSGMVTICDAGVGVAIVKMCDETVTDSSTREEDKGQNRISREA